MLIPWKETEITKKTKGRGRRHHYNIRWSLRGGGFPKLKGDRLLGGGSFHFRAGMNSVNGLKLRGGEEVRGP